MNSKIFSIFFLIIFFGSMVSFVSAQEIGDAPRIPTEPLNEPSAEELRAVEARQIQERIVNILLIVSLIVSLIIGIILMKYMIKYSPKNINLIIHGLVFLGSLIWFFSMLYLLGSQLIIRGNIADPDAIEMGWPAILLLGFSGYVLYNLIKKPNFAKNKKYTLSLSSGMIITSILAVLSFMTIGYIFRLEGLAIALLWLLVFTVGAILSFILGIIGLFIDRAKNK